MGAEHTALLLGSQPRAWHCAVLHALGIGLVRIAERLDRAPARILPWEPFHARLADREEHLLDLRHRLHSRYY